MIVTLDQAHFAPVQVAVGELVYLDQSVTGGGSGAVVLERDVARELAEQLLAAISPRSIGTPA